MAKFTVEQAAAVLAVQQVINQWATAMDIDNGLTMAPLLTPDCVYTVRAIPRHGPETVVQFYTDRLKEFADAGTEPPVHRHLLTNFRVNFPAADHAAVQFQLLYFAGPGTAPIITQNMPVAVADVSMECRCDTTGEWLISRFDSSQSFIRG
jgi:hypothetical protein